MTIRTICLKCDDVVVVVVTDRPEKGESNIDVGIEKRHQIFFYRNARRWGWDILRDDVKPID